MGLLFTQIPFHILLPDGKEDNWEPKGNNNKAQAPSAKSQEKETPIIDLVNENSGIETRAPSREPVTNSEPKFGTNQDESTSMTFSEREFNENKSLRPKIPTEPPKDQNGPGNSQNLEAVPNTANCLVTSLTKMVKNHEQKNEMIKKFDQKNDRTTSSLSNLDNFEAVPSAKNYSMTSLTNMDKNLNLEAPKVRKSTRIGRGLKDCHQACSGCTAIKPNQQSINLL